MAAPPPRKRHPYNQWTPDARALDLVGDKWTLLIIRDLAAGPRRFVELQRMLPGISTEQLRSRLGRMVADGLLTRERFREVPPRVEYELTQRARDLLPVVGALAQWGYRWVWSEPESGEIICVLAILRSLPGITVTDDVEGTIAVELTDYPNNSLVKIEGGSIAVAESADQPEADARLTGTIAEFAKAFSPGGTIDNVKLSGSRHLANVLFDLIAPERGAAGAPA